MNTHIEGDFQICISVPLNKNVIIIIIIIIIIIDDDYFIIIDDYR